jgi:hypothetical protein
VKEVVAGECILFAVASVRFGGEPGWTRQSTCGQQWPKGRILCVLSVWIHSVFKCMPCELSSLLVLLIYNTRIMLYIEIINNRPYKGKDKVIPVLNYVRTTPWRRMCEWSYSSTIRELGTKWGWVGSFTIWPLYPLWNSLQYPLDMSLGGPQNRSGHCGEDKNLLPLPRIEPPRSPGCSSTDATFPNFVHSLDNNRSWVRLSPFLLRPRIDLLYQSLVIRVIIDERGVLVKWLLTFESIRRPSQRITCLSSILFINMADVWIREVGLALVPLNIVPWNAVLICL